MCGTQSLATHEPSSAVPRTMSLHQPSACTEWSELARSRHAETIHCPSDAHSSAVRGRAAGSAELAGGWREVGEAAGCDEAHAGSTPAAPATRKGSQRMAGTV